MAEAASRRARATRGEVARLAALFKSLGSPARLRILRALRRDGERRAGDLAREAGLTPQAASNQLRRLARMGVVAARRHGAGMHYRITDPCVPALLEKGACLVRGECRPPRDE